MGLLVLGSGVLAGCPNKHIGREFLRHGTFNEVYFEQSQELEKSKAVERRRVIAAYTALLYMDAEVASRAVREVADVRPEHGIRPFPGIDESIAFAAMQRLIPLQIEERNWPALLAMLRDHQSLLLLATKDDSLVPIVVALEELQSQSELARDTSEVARSVESQIRRLPGAMTAKRQELLDRVSKVASPQTQP